MAKALHLTEPPWRAVECLACHAPAAAAGHAAAADHLLSDGVGCEACHGAAADWIEPHRRRDWSDPAIWSSDRKRRLGYQDTKDLLTRAMTCADCHVGGAGRDVNHDLIAAGHPRLTFELAAYNALLPAHWKRRDDRARQAANPEHRQDALASSLQAQTWILGQLVTAERSLNLLAERSQQEQAPWPELAEYGCFTCHHDLSDPSWRQARESFGLRPGQLPWATWDLALVEHVDRIVSGQADRPVGASLQRLRNEMQRPGSDRRIIGPLAEQAREEFARLAVIVNSHSPSHTDIHGWWELVLADSDDLVGRGWDSATQLYLAAVALKQGYYDASGRFRQAPWAVDRKLSLIRDQLDFRTVPTLIAVSPSGIANFASPKYFDDTRIEKIQSLFQAMRETMDDGLNFE